MDSGSEEEATREPERKKCTKAETKQARIDKCLKLATQASTFLIFIEKDHTELRKHMKAVMKLTREIGGGGKGGKDHIDRRKAGKSCRPSKIQGT